MKRILVIDGGGLRGFIPLQVLQRVEKRTGRPLWETFDLVVGTSVGAILGGLVASGALTAHDIAALMDEAAPRMFTRRQWPLLPKYSRQPFEEAWRAEVGSIRLGDCTTTLMTTAVNLCDGRTHYFKSDDPADAEMPLEDAVAFSFAAPLFFGGIPDKKRKAVWLDGGTGIDNCPILEALYEVIHRGWLAEEDGVHILSLGCGFIREGMPYKRASRKAGRNVREILAFMKPTEGGMARQQSVDSRVSLSHRVAEFLPQLGMQRLDVQISGELDKLDGVKYIGEYKKLGERLAASVDLSPLQ